MTVRLHFWILSSEPRLQVTLRGRISIERSAVMAGQPANTTEDIRKMGYLIKIKTNKKKYFVLRDETNTNSARLEYYDKESKWRSGGLAKRTIILKNCFSINTKLDAKHKYAITLYTKEDCFAIACQNEEEQQDWLSSMIELRSSTSSSTNDSTLTKPPFEHIWPVTVKSRGLGGSERKVVPGQYRLCLTNMDLSLISLNDKYNIVLPLDCIRRCGHTNQFFFLELGRSAKTGAGNLWLQVEDMIIAQNIHEALLSSMKNSEVPAPGIFRLRSGSSATEKGRKRSSLVSTGASSLQQPKRSLSIYSSTSSPNACPENPLSKKNRERSLLHKASPEDISSNFTPHPAGATSIPDDSIKEEPAKGDGYAVALPMTADQPSYLNRGTSCKQTKPPPTLVVAPPQGATNTMPFSEVIERKNSKSASDYMEEDNSYMMMAQPSGNPHPSTTRTEQHGSNSSVSSVISSVGSMSNAEFSENSFRSLSQLQEIKDGGYIEMTSPQNNSEGPNLVPIRPDIVSSYVRDENVEEFPKRAYSVGSKPGIVPNKPLNNSYIDMTGSSKVRKEAEKSSSAPHLNDDDEKKKELSDLFMELDFNRRGKKDLQGTSLQNAKDFRDRTSSGGSRDLRLKAMSFTTRDAIQKLSIFSGRKNSAPGQHADGRRLRTSTICQESLRPRTSSFGPSDLRPRSSSGGNACFADVMSKEMHISGQSSQDSLRKHRQKSSQESMDSTQCDPYMDMLGGKPSMSKTQEGDAGYIDMKPGDDPNYMKMSAGGSGASDGVVTGKLGGNVTLRQKLETVKAGKNDDYMEMAADSRSGMVSQVKSGNGGSAQPRTSMMKAVPESRSNYMEMAPGGSPGEMNSLMKSGKKDASIQPKNSDYMQMEVSVRRSGSSCESQSPIQKTVTSSSTPTSQTNLQGGSDKTSLPTVSFVMSQKEDVAKSSIAEAHGTVRAAPVTEPDAPLPAPFELRIPLHSFLHYTSHVDETNATIPAAATSRVQHGSSGTDSAGDSRRPITNPPQISYATLDLGSSVDDSIDSRHESSGGMDRGLGPATHHIYAQIDFRRSEDHSK